MSKGVVLTLMTALLGGFALGSMVSPRTPTAHQMYEQIKNARSNRKPAVTQSKEIPPEVVFLVFASKLTGAARK